MIDPEEFSRGEVFLDDDDDDENDDDIDDAAADCNKSIMIHVSQATGPWARHAC